MARGKQESVYVTWEARAAVRRHAERSGLSYSAALCELVLRGEKAGSGKETGKAKR